MIDTRTKNSTLPGFLKDSAKADKSVLLSTKELSLNYGDFQALHAVSLDFSTGEVTALIGPSGCGKSSYLRSLNLMNREISGCEMIGGIIFKGKNVNTKEQNTYELRKHIGMVFQQPNPFKMSIFENVAFALRRHGAQDESILEERVYTALMQAALFDEVKDKLHKSAYALSGGQAQRLCIARTLALEPEVILMDEPCSALDPLATFAIEETMRAIAEAGVCVICVTHNMEQAARVSDKTAFFLQGEMVEVGATKSIFSTPQDKRTNDYLTGRFG